MKKILDYHIQDTLVCYSGELLEWKHMVASCEQAIVFFTFKHHWAKTMFWNTTDHPHSHILLKILVFTVLSDPLFWQKPVAPFALHTFSWKTIISAVYSLGQNNKKKGIKGNQSMLTSHIISSWHTVTALTHTHAQHAQKFNFYTHIHLQNKTTFSDILSKMHHWQITKTLPHAGGWT